MMNEKWMMNTTGRKQWQVPELEDVSVDVTAGGACCEDNEASYLQVKSGS